MNELGKNKDEKKGGGVTMASPHQVTRDFEAALCEYTGSKYAVVVNSCTMALLLACKFHYGEYPVEGHRITITDAKECIIPSKTYVSVPQSVIHAGHTVRFIDYPWAGEYQISPLPVWDSARRFTSGMYREGQMQCLSFHWTKILGDTQGGAILHDNDEADAWFRKARFDGRTEGVPCGEDDFDMIGYHCYISPDVSARLLAKLSVLPKHNADLPNDPYPDLSKHDIFTRS